jgi:uncharacterized ion transporter superfamily protein YfcC
MWKTTVTVAQKIKKNKKKIKKNKKKKKEKEEEEEEEEEEEHILINGKMINKKVTLIKILEFGIHLFPILMSWKDWIPIGRLLDDWPTSCTSHVWAVSKLGFKFMGPD